MTNTAPKHGMSAKYPGKGVRSLKVNAAVKMTAIPVSESALFAQSGSFDFSAKSQTIAPRQNSHIRVGVMKYAKPGAKLVSKIEPISEPTPTITTRANKERFRLKLAFLLSSATTTRAKGHKTVLLGRGTKTVALVIGHSLAQDS